MSISTVSYTHLLEIVGTGGDGSNSFNISTTASLVIAAGGVPVAKHGNRAASSKSGAADVLEALGVKITLTPEQSEKILEKIGICFLFAQTYHTAMKYVAPVRKELGIRTVFNILGPLTNPANADVYKRQDIAWEGECVNCWLTSKTDQEVRVRVKMQESRTVFLKAGNRVKFE